MDDICRKAIDTWGAKQTMKLIEEMSELTKEISKNFFGADNIDHIAEEIADVEIMLCQMKMLYDCGARVDRWRGKKLNRLKLKLAAENVS